MVCLGGRRWREAPNNVTNERVAGDVSASGDGGCVSDEQADDQEAATAGGLRAAGGRRRPRLSTTPGSSQGEGRRRSGGGGGGGAQRGAQVSACPCVRGRCSTRLLIRTGVAELPWLPRHYNNSAIHLALYFSS